MQRLNYKSKGRSQAGSCNQQDSTTKYFLSIGLIIVILILIFQVGAKTALAKNPASLNQKLARLQAWESPKNLSHSGAASQPRVFAGPKETLQVFWIDRFDGLVSSVYDGKVWSDAFLANITGPEKILSESNDMPFLIADHTGWVHAFWIVTVQPVNGEGNSSKSSLNSLYHSKMPFGGSVWSTAELLAEDALVFSVDAPLDGGLRLAYIRRINSELNPSGVYYKKLNSGSEGWEASQNIYKSIYYRLLAPGDGSVSITDDGDGHSFIVWKDPFKAQTFISTSTDHGLSWAGPNLLGESQNQSASINLGAMPGTVLAIWQTPEAGRCSLNQQTWLGPTTEPAAVQSESNTEAEPATDWSSPEQIFPYLENCPSSNRFLTELEENTPSGKTSLYWLWGEGSSSLSISAWAADISEWSIPLVDSFRFENPEGSGQTVLGDLHAAMTDGRLALTGSDSNGEIWITRSERTIEDFIYAPPSAWSAAQAVTNNGQTALDPAMVMDSRGVTHLIWVQPKDIESDYNRLGAALIYSQTTNSFPENRQEGAAARVVLSDQVEIFPGNPNEIIRQPALLVDEGTAGNPEGIQTPSESATLLHLVWSGGEQGDIMYSRAPLDNAEAASEWFSTQVVSSSAYASWPQIGMDASQRLYILYTVSLNEERGLYLTISQDHGQTWEPARRIFDGAAAGMQAVDHPTLLASGDGILHIAWVETTPAGSHTTQGIYYSVSKDGGLTWSDPLILAGPGYDWPRLSLAGGQLHLIYAEIAPIGGLIWHRSRPIDRNWIAGSPQPNPTSPVETLTPQNPGDENLWSLAQRVPGWNIVALPYGLAVDGTPENGSLHLAGNDQFSNTLIYSVWKDGSWGTSENFTPPKGTVQLSSSAIVGGGGSSIAATRPEGEKLAVAWLERNSSALFLTTREIDKIDIPIVPAIIPTAAPTATLAPNATIFIPTPTPDLNRVPPPNGATQAPLIIGGTLAAIFVISLFAGRLVSRNRKK